MVIIVVKSVDDIPVAKNDLFNVRTGLDISSTVASNDTLSGDGGNVWTIGIASTRGVLNFNNDGSFTYTPISNYYGKDSFQYTITDVDGSTSSAKAIITINDLPKAFSDRFTIEPTDSIINASVTSNDYVSNDHVSTDSSNLWMLVTRTRRGQLPGEEMALLILPLTIQRS